MKVFKSVPTEKGQIEIQNEYGKTVSFLVSYKWLFQIISFFTGLASINFLFIPFFVFIFGAKAALYFTLAFAVLIAFTIELFLFKITPEVLGKLFSKTPGAAKVISRTLTILCFALLAISFSISFLGSKQIVRTFAPKPVIKSTKPAETKANNQRLSIQNAFTIDTKLILSNKKSLVLALNNSYKAKAAIEKQKIRNYQAKAKAENRSYKSSISWLKSKLAKMKAEHQAEILQIEKESGLQLARLAELKRLEQSKNNSLLLASTTKINTTNDRNRSRSENKIQSFGFGLAWFTVFAQIGFLLVCFIESKYKNLVGIKDQIVLQNIDLIGNVFGLAYKALADRFKTIAANKIYHFVSLSPTLARPAGQIEQIYNFDNIRNSVLNVSTKEQEPEFLEIESQISGLLNESQKASSANDTKAAKFYNLKANEVIKTYLGNDTSQEQIEAFRNQVIEFLSGKTGNPFDENHRQKYNQKIGFFHSLEQAAEKPGNIRLSGNQESGQNRQPETGQKAAGKTAICLNCSNTFFLNVWNKKYCSDSCKADHKKKLYGKTYQENFYKISNK